jgi:hypothetical protein
MFSYKKKQWKPPSKKEKEEKFQGLSLRKRKACNISSNALMQSIVETKTQITMKSNKKTLHEREHK